MNSLWIQFKICMCISYDSWEINLTQWHTVSRFHVHSFTISVKSKVLFSAVCGLHVTDGWFLSNMVSICLRLSWHPCFNISVPAPISIKTMSQKFHCFWGKGFCDAAKYCWCHNDSMHFMKNKGEGNLFSVFLMMLPKHVHTDRNLQWRLKSSISFILKHIFIYFLYFAQVA